MIEKKHLIAVIAIILIVIGVLAVINALLPDYVGEMMIERLSELENETNQIKEQADRITDVVMELAKQKGIEV